MKLSDIKQINSLTPELKKYLQLLSDDRYLIISKGSSTPKIVELPYGLHGKKKLIKHIRIDQMLDLIDAASIEFYRKVGSRRIYRPANK